MNTHAADFIQRLTEASRDQSFPNSRPRDAATLILIDRSGPVPQILLGRRHDGHKFMPGKFVFPGGRVEPFDRHMSSATPLDARVEARLMQSVKRPNRERARAMVLAAIRETFEETGLMLGVKASQVRGASGPWAQFAQFGVQPDLAGLHFIARAITPPRRPKRFDTRFFSADTRAIVHRVDGIVGPDSELVELVWVPLGEAKRLDLPSITHVVLDELEARIAAGFSHDAQVPFYRMVRGRFTREML
ncbi:MAG TPA: NUDIX hydrolase [Xanthobacteraceae bacterium]|jgi:8-oxo-dGTP pyrophosphatase MutT (NUDIX family)|nr:NUDIX hydrolase [Xanthobacteraceae bacterium]